MKLSASLLLSCAVSAFAISLPTSVNLPSSQADCGDHALFIQEDFKVYWKGDYPSSSGFNIGSAVEGVLNEMIAGGNSKQAYRYEKDIVTISTFTGANIDDKLDALVSLYLGIAIDDGGYPEYMYMEYATGNPLTTWGVIVAHSSSSESSDLAVKKWSSGQSFNDYSNSEDVGKRGVCYLEESFEGAPTTSNLFGNCLTVTYDSSKTLKEQIGYDFDNVIKAYNNGKDSFSNGDNICISLGNIVA